jgi:hypothetical protein
MVRDINASNLALRKYLTSTDCITKIYKKQSNYMSLLIETKQGKVALKQRTITEIGLVETKLKPTRMPIPEATRSNTWIWGRSFAGTAGFCMFGHKFILLFEGFCLITFAI